MKTKTYIIDEHQRNFLMGQIRKELRINEKKVVTLCLKFGKEANTCALDARRRWLEDFYRQLGGTVEQITNLNGRPINRSALVDSNKDHKRHS